MTTRDSWDAAAQARASDRWAACAARWNTAMTDALLSAAALTPNSVVLDLAAGSGDPALSIAERVNRGRVIALDSSRAGLLLASTHAPRLGLGAKVSFVQADAHAIVPTGPYRHWLGPIARMWERAYKPRPGHVP